VLLGYGQCSFLNCFVDCHNLFSDIRGSQMTPGYVDRCISAEIPDLEVYPDLHHYVITNMVHGPCGVHNPSAPCMKNGVCDKGYPKDFQPYTILTEGSFAQMRRRSPSQGGFTFGKTVSRGGFTNIVHIDNSWIVPYPPFLLCQFQCHLNLEICASVSSVKYVLKYTFKGPDRAVYNLESTDSPVNEISDYENRRY